MNNSELLKEINRLQDLLAKHGICEDCGELYNHHGDEPFASCGCNQSEWYQLTPHMLQVQSLKAERDALVARNYELVGLILRMRDRWWPFVHGSVCPSTTAYNLGKESADILSKTPQQCLLDIQADAGRKGFIACLNFACHTPDNWISLADKYAESLRQGGEYD